MQIQPTLIAAPSLIERDMKVVRSADDTEQTYRSRCELFDLLVGHWRVNHSPAESRA